MHILFFDLTYAIGHKYYDEKMIENLAKVSKLHVICPKEWYRKESEGVIYKYIAKSLGKKRSTTFDIFINGIRNSIRASKYFRGENVDAIVIGKHDYFSMPIARLLFPRDIPLFLIQHNEIDQLNVPGLKGQIKRICFSFFKRKVIHCVLEEFIKDYLVSKEQMDIRMVCCWPHPIERDVNYSLEKKTYDCVAISTSNNESIVKEILEREKSVGDLKIENRQVILRSQTETFDDGYLKVFHGWIDDALYSEYINHAKSVLIAFKEGYCNRVSASIFDAFSQHIPVICTDMPLARYYESKYGNICSIMHNDLSSTLRAVDENSLAYESQFWSFWEDHCDKKIQSILQNDFDRLIRNRNMKAN